MPPTPAHYQERANHRNQHQTLDQQENRQTPAVARNLGPKCNRNEREATLHTVGVLPHSPEAMAMARKEGRGSMSRRRRASEAGLLENWSTLARGRKAKSGRAGARRCTTLTKGKGKGRAGKAREGREGPTYLSLSPPLSREGRKPARHLKGTFVCYAALWQVISYLSLCFYHL